jgi:hypothetical protein
VLVQPGRTSVDPRHLDRIAADHPDDFEIIPIARGADETYLHAKLILLKLGKQAICLQGSPNLSQVALVRAGDGANIELANLLRGRRDEFDHLFAGVALGKAASAQELSLAYEPEESPLPPVLEGWHLIRAEWRGSELTLHLSAELPELGETSLLIGEQCFAFSVLRSAPMSITVKLEKEAGELLERSASVALEWSGESGRERSNPVFAYNLVALERTLEAAIGSERLAFVGSLDGLDDEELERLLQELADSVVIDPQGLWKLAGREPPTEADEDELWLAYEDVDYEALRQHPKLTQYAAGFGSGGGQRSRLQIILASIAASFAPDRSQLTAPAALAALDETEAESEEELEERAEEREQRRATLEAHLRRIFQNFIRRYLRGATSEEFEQRVGPEVVAQNYLIFSFILWRLFRKAWMPADFLIESLLKTWSHFWGGVDQQGFMARLDDERRKQTLAWLQDQQTNGLLIASLYYAAYLTRVGESDQLRLELRDFWRKLVCAPPFSLDSSVVEDAVAILAGLVASRPPTSQRLALELGGLSDFETRSSFIASLGGAGAAWFDQAQIMRPAIKRPDNVDCLVLRSEPDQAAMLEMLARWMRFEQCGFYRVQVKGSQAVCFYDTLVDQGVYWGGGGAAAQDFEERPTYDAPWDEPLDRLFGPNRWKPGDRLAELTDAGQVAAAQ